MIRPAGREQDADERESTGDSKIEERPEAPRTKIERNRSEQRDGRRSEDDPAEPLGDDFGDVGHLREWAALLGRRTGDLLQEHGDAHAAPAGRMLSFREIRPLP